MELLTEIVIRKATHSRINEVDFDNLEFGKYVADHMLVCDYANGEWGNAQVVPFANLSLNPATLALHYGQTVFEGMKAFRMEDGRINIFRLERHYDRFARSLQSMSMAVPPKEIFTEGLLKLVEIDKQWVPSKTGCALYLRPFVFASEAKFGIKISEQYRFIVFSGPVPEVYERPIKVKVERKYIRAAKGGTGYAKCSGNYGGAFYPTQKAREEGFDQVLWTDAYEHEYFEESGTMNLMFVIDEKLITPPLSDSILDGITRDSLLVIANHLGIETEVRPVSINEILNAIHEGRSVEAFGAGTAAVVAPISVIGVDGELYHLPIYSHGSIMFKLKRELEAIRTGKRKDTYGWNNIL